MTRSPSRVASGWRLDSSFKNTMKRLIAILLFTLAMLMSGCLTREMTRYTADGKPWSKDKITAFMVRGEVTALKEDVNETAEGDYHRKVTLGSLKGETETDKLAALVEAAAKGATAAALKSVIPIPAP